MSVENSANNEHFVLSSDACRKRGTEPRSFGIAAALVSAIALGACTSSGGEGIDNAFDVNKREAEQRAEESVTDLRAYCPKTVLRAGTETFRTYTSGTDREAPEARENIVYQANITDVVRECRRSGGVMTIRVGAAGRIITGPKGAPGAFEMPLRVAVTRGDEVLYSTLHQVPASIPPGRSNGTFSFVDNNVAIPIPDKENIIVYVGYDEGPPA